MKTKPYGGWGRLCLSKSGKWLVGAVLLGLGFANSASVWAQGSETRFGFIENRAPSYTQRPGYGVYSTTMYPPVNTYGFKHAETVVEKGTRVALLNTSSRSVPSSSSGSGINVPPPNLMVVSGLPRGTTTRSRVTPNRPLFPRRNLGLQTTKDGFYVMPRTRNLPDNGRTLSARRNQAKTSAFSKTRVKSTKRVGLRNLFRRNKGR